MGLLCRHYRSEYNASCEAFTGRLTLSLSFVMYSSGPSVFHLFASICAQRSTLLQKLRSLWRLAALTQRGAHSYEQD